MRARQHGGTSLLIAVILLAGALLYAWLYHPTLLRRLLQAESAASVPPKPAAAPAESARQREARWMAFYQPHPSCAKATELAKLECMSDREAQRTRFEAQARAPQAQAAAQRPK